MPGPAAGGRSRCMFVGNRLTVTVPRRHSGWHHAASALKFFWKLPRTDQFMDFMLNDLEHLSGITTDSEAISRFQVFKLEVFVTRAEPESSESGYVPCSESG